MRTETIIVANLKCNGCASSIKKELSKIPGVQDVAVDVEQDKVVVTYEENDETRPKVIHSLHSLGYPEATEKNGLLLQLKSYTSCMIGKMNNLNN
jgi:copper chaperone